MKRFITVILSLLMVFSIAAFTNFCYGAKPITVKLSFTAPQKGQQVKAGQAFTCKGKFQCNPRNTKLNQIHIWLFLMDRDGNLNRYWIQKPVTLNNKGLWEGSIKPTKGIFQAVAVLTDPNTDKLFKTWLAQGNVSQQYELPRGALILASVRVKTTSK
jgi:hypothetical protein